MSKWLTLGIVFLTYKRKRPHKSCCHILVCMKRLPHLNPINSKTVHFKGCWIGYWNVGKQLGEKRKISRLPCLNWLSQIKSGVVRDQKQSFPTGHLRQESKWHLRWRVLTFDEVWCPRVTCSYGRKTGFLQEPVTILQDPSSQHLRSTVSLRASYSELYKSRLRREAEWGENWSLV